MKSVDETDFHEDFVVKQVPAIDGDLRVVKLSPTFKLSDSPFSLNTKPKPYSLPKSKPTKYLISQGSQRPLISSMATSSSTKDSTNGSRVEERVVRSPKGFFEGSEIA
ncbi:unnamed protein product [Vicia faba]|uniref:Uncharacterized protein n=1 Tax=Vicia faba TaxID=3906 RepID=A0AAV0YX74_VICFA|nr:unnamed protein product [Vicia faba]